MGELYEIIVSWLVRCIRRRVDSENDCKHDSDVGKTSKPSNDVTEDLSRLICGSAAAGTDIGDILLHVGQCIDDVASEIRWLGSQDDRRMTMFGPFLGRSLLELAATALCGRLDPFRLLIIREVQSRSDYQIDVVWNVSMRWQADVVVPKDKKENVDSLGNVQLEYEKMSKALLGGHYDTIVWRPAVQRMLDAATEKGVLIAGIAKDEPKSFIPLRRESIGRLYSAFSKGIHNEFVLPPGAKLDRSTVRDLLSKTVALVAELALVSHFTAHAYAPLTADEAFDTFNRIESTDVIS